MMARPGQKPTAIKHAALLVLIVLVVFLLDRWTKWLAVNKLFTGETIIALPGLLHFRLMRNTGMALGILADGGILNTILPVTVIIAGWLVLRVFQRTAYIQFAAALITGGFLGNLLDRIHLGYVTDMVFFPWMPWYICNLADIAITIGVVMLAISLLFRPKDWIRKNGGGAA